MKRGRSPSWEAPLPEWLQPHGDDVLLDLLVVPRAARTRVMGVQENRLRIQIDAPAESEQGNVALIRFLADTLDVARAQVEIVGGPSSRRKTVRLLRVPLHLIVLRLSPHESS